MVIGFLGEEKYIRINNEVCPALHNITAYTSPPLGGLMLRFGFGLRYTPSHASFSPNVVNK
jgi:hypothetical protein